MKTYVTILVGIAALCAVVFGGYSFMKSREIKPELAVQSAVHMKMFSGNVVRIFEGENKLSYSFDIPENATTSVEMEGALIKIVDAASPYATIYISYEGGRGFGPLDYISEVIAPHVSVIDPKEVITVGENQWQVAESEGSEWHIASVANGSWLIIVENKKTVHDAVEKTLESLKVK